LQQHSKIAPTLSMARPADERAVENSSLAVLHHAASKSMCYRGFHSPWYELGL
jgi:hypothetical protein